MAPLYLALDIGEKRIGLALGSIEIPVHGKGTLVIDSDEWQPILAGLIAQECVRGIVLGYPKVVSGDETTSGALVKQWGDILQRAFGLPISFVNEAYSSVEAERQLRLEGVDTATQKGAVDERAAELILRQFLESE